MNYFLAKTEPGVYSIQDLEKERRTSWTGVRNAQALMAIRTMKPGDRVFIYHSNGESAVVGVAKVLTNSQEDPNDPKSAFVDLEFVAHISPSVTLKEIKTSGEFDDWALVRQSRLSTMAAPEKFVKWMRKKYPKLKL